MTDNGNPQTPPARLTQVGRFSERRPDGSTRPHVLAICDAGTTRLLIECSPGQPTRLLAILRDPSADQPGDLLPQITAICGEYVHHYRRTAARCAAA